jgi:RNA recognition motif-containing protein
MSLPQRELISAIPFMVIITTLFVYLNDTCIQTATNSATAATAPRRPIVQMPDEYLPPNKILFLQNLPTDVRQDQLIALFGQYPGLAEVRMIPTKKDIAFVEFVDETTAGVAKDALHNYKLDGENKIKARTRFSVNNTQLLTP